MKASIYSIDRKHICDATVAEKGTDYVTVIVPDHVVKQINTDNLLILYDDMYGLMTYETELENFRKKIGSNFTLVYKVRFRLINLVDVSQRRSNVKVKVNFDASLSLYSSDGRELVDAETEEPIQVFGVVRDLSAGGILFLSTDTLELGQNFAFIFDQGTIPVKIMGSVIRITHIDAVFSEYGCKFINISVSKEAIVREYVFKCQLAVRKKKLLEESEDME